LSDSLSTTIYLSFSPVFLRPYLSIHLMMR